MKTVHKYRNLRRLCTLYKHFQTENLRFFVLSWKCYGLSRVEFYLYLGISILILMYNVYAYRYYHSSGFVAQWIRRLSNVQEDPGSNPTVGKNFSF